MLLGIGQACLGFLFGILVGSDLTINGMTLAARPYIWLCLMLSSVLLTGVCERCEDIRCHTSVVAPVSSMLL